MVMMIIKNLAVAVAGLIGLGIIAIGVRFLLAPRTAAAGYGVAIREETGRPVRTSRPRAYMTSPPAWLCSC
jgi:hypothetical protein